MLMQKNLSCLVLIDVQEKLTPLVQNHKEIVARSEWLLRLAKDLSVPLLVCEQYSKGLGPTINALQEVTSGITPIEKVHFSCFKSLSFQQQLNATGKKQIILIGIETHVCVLQTALDLLDKGYHVFIVVDAVSSRNELDKHFGLKRMKQAGATLVTSEMVFFEWVEKAGTPEFKALSKAYLQD